MDREAGGLWQQQQRCLAHVEPAQPAQPAQSLAEGGLLRAPARAEQVTAEQQHLQPRHVAQVVKPGADRVVSDVERQQRRAALQQR